MSIEASNCWQQQQCAVGGSGSEGPHRWGGGGLVDRIRVQPACCCTRVDAAPQPHPIACHIRTVHPSTCCLLVPQVLRCSKRYAVSIVIGWSTNTGQQQHLIEIAPASTTQIRCTTTRTRGLHTATLLCHAAAATIHTHLCFYALHLSMTGGGVPLRTPLRTRGGETPVTSHTPAWCAQTTGRAAA